jgi:putative ABC transport system permease protein
MRSILTVLGVIGVAAVVCMVAVGEGARAQVSDAIRKTGTNLLYISPGAVRDGGVVKATGTQHTLTEDDARAILRDIPGILGPVDK